MKTALSLIAAAVALSGSAFAGQPPIDKKMMAPVEELYGLGWYGAIEGGVNVYQDSGGTREFTTRRGNKISLDPNNDVGGFGGLKLGYVFGTGVVRPAFEADLFYNGVDANVDVKVNGDTKDSVSARIDSGAFMGNALLRFSFERCQPYFGFGIGYWVAQGHDVTIHAGDNERSHASTNSKGDLAWQLIAGTDYYFSPKVSAFIEYKFLNYEDAILDNAVRQQLIGLGVRFHF